NMASPIAAVLPGPSRRAAIAPGTATRARARLKLIRTQETPSTVVSNCLNISGRASTTID
ncbi:MAG: hypothetical protein ACKOL0_00490, partial [Solirubrobacterales bacterium]